jgi:predicted XRE-type DNA-binding protein/phage-related protein
MEQSEGNPEILLRSLVWMGDSLDNLREFPPEVRTAVGYALQLVQAGETPMSAKPFKGVASGVYEIVKRYDTDTYRAVYAVKIGEPKSIDSSGNVFSDLKLDDADELFARGKIGIQVIKLLKRRNLKQREISELLEISQPEVSHLMNGEFQRFSEGKLISFLKRLNVEITLHILDRHLANETSETLISL